METCCICKQPIGEDEGMYTEGWPILRHMHIECVQVEADKDEDADWEEVTEDD